MIHRILNWLRSLFRKQPRYRYKTTDHEPAQLEAGVIYAETHQGTPWRLIMLCPCGCKSSVYLNLNPAHKPYWRIKINNHKINISPSVQRTTGCKSHYFIIDSRTTWCR